MEFGWQIAASDWPLDRTAGFVSRDIAPEVPASRHSDVRAQAVEMIGPMSLNQSLSQGHFASDLIEGPTVCFPISLRREAPSLDPLPPRGSPGSGPPVCRLESSERTHTASATGSSADTSNKRLFSARVSAKAPASPAASPTRSIERALRKVCDTTSPGRAPSAMRMPISRRCSRYRVRQNAVKSQRGQQCGDTGEGAHHPGGLLRPEHALLLHLLHRPHVSQRQMGIDLPHRFPNSGHRRHRIAPCANHQFDVLPRGLGPKVHRPPALAARAIRRCARCESRPRSAGFTTDSGIGP